MVARFRYKGAGRPGAGCGHQRLTDLGKQLSWGHLGRKDPQREDCGHLHAEGDLEGELSAIQNRFISSSGRSPGRGEEESING